MIATIQHLWKSYKLPFQIGFSLLFIGLGIYFLRQEHHELVQVRNTLILASPWKVVLGLAITALFVWVQGMMYQQSFKAINATIPVWSGMMLFLKRNLVSVFCPQA